MTIKFYQLVEGGCENLIATYGKMPFIPRVGESVMFDDKSGIFIVAEVSYVYPTPAEWNNKEALPYVEIHVYQQP